MNEAPEPTDGGRKLVLAGIAAAAVLALGGAAAGVFAFLSLGGG